MTDLRMERDRAKARHDSLVARYNREYRAGKWSTNRPLAGKCEDAYDVWQRAEVALNFQENDDPCDGS